MRVPTEYERCLQRELHRYFREQEEGKIMPSWFVHEFCVYYWMSRLNRRMYRILGDRTVSKQMLFRLEHIRSSRYGRYKNISPILQKSVQKLISELGELNDNLIDDSEMWRKPYLLSRKGLERWEQAIEATDECTRILPDLELWHQKDASIQKISL